ncbi:hypothetical protein B0H34DRAFT_701820 [Crassisporium funariophilum]|nr:hypothetical protein B0H34DRAFT_701820 [Crassisporium funariophilum]
MDNNWTTLAGKLEGIRDHTSAEGTTSNEMHKTVAQLINARNTIVASVGEMRAETKEVLATVRALDNRLADLEATQAPHYQATTGDFVPAEKRGRYEGYSNSTLMPALLPALSAATAPHPPSSYAPTPPRQHYAPTAPPAHHALYAPGPRRQIPKSLSVRLGPVNWTSRIHDDVLAIIAMLPSHVTSSLNTQNIRVTSTHEALFARVMFGSASEATAFVQAWASSRPAMYRDVSAQYGAGN